MAKMNHRNTKTLSMGTDETTDNKIVEVLEKTVTTEVTKRIGALLQAVVHDAVVEAIVAASHVGETPAEAAPAEPKQAQAAQGANPHRPRAGGRCAAVWDELDRLRAENDVPMLSDIMKVGRQRKWNENNTRVEYYQWRKFHGIRGRLGSRKAPPRRSVINVPSYRGPDRRSGAS
jgi:ribosomal protein L12E/L44/L45/RPP1/RPP2